MKILYVEDEITKNISKLKRLFKKYLNEEIIDELNKIEDDEYGADEKEIERIIEKSDFIDLEYSFQGALDKIINNHEEYCIFIVDRNLSSYAYDIESLKAIDGSFSKIQYEKFREREGDYLLEKLIYEKEDVLNRFYFLTAYSASELPNKEEISKHIDFRKFREENIIEKSNREREQNLISIINNAEILNIHFENKDYIDFMKAISGKLSTSNIVDFVELIRTQYSEEAQTIEMNLGRIRKITEYILSFIAKNFKAPRDRYTKKKEDQIVFGKVVSWLSNKIGEKKEYRLNSNVIIESYLYNIQSICSEFGVHRNESKETSFFPTSNTVKALVFELKEIMLWAKSIL